LPNMKIGTVPTRLLRVEWDCPYLFYNPLLFFKNNCNNFPFFTSYIVEGTMAAHRDKKVEKIP